MLFQLEKNEFGLNKQSNYLACRKIELNMQLLYYKITYFQNGCKQFLLTFY
jgi:hypothetical protein